MDRTLPTAYIPPIKIFTAWSRIGLQSFGGGSSTFSLIHHAAVQRGWLSEDEFVRAWALAQIAPGVNLVKLTAMIGYRLHGWLGVLAAMSGLLLPSATVTVLMTAGYTVIRNLAVIQAMAKGILPAAIGLSLAMAVQMAAPIFSRARTEGPLRLSAHLFVLAGAAGLMAVVGLSPVVILLLSGVVAVGLFILIPVSKPTPSATQDRQ